MLSHNHGTPITTHSIFKMSSVFLSGVEEDFTKLKMADSVILFFFNIHLVLKVVIRTCNSSPTYPLTVWKGTEEQPGEKILSRILVYMAVKVINFFSEAP